MASLLLLATLLAAAATASLAQDGSVRVCIPEAADAAAVAACSAALAAADPALACVAGGSPDACSQLLRDGKAELAKFGPSSVYIASRDYGLAPVLVERYGAGSEATYFAVAAVKEALCDSKPGFGLADLKGLRACMTGYRKTAGWFMPVGALVESGAMPVVTAEGNVQADAQSVAAFFSEVCAPRTTDDGPAAGGLPFAPLCAACAGDCSDDAAREPYYDYAGTIKGLDAGACDVAFTKETVVQGAAGAGLRLVCPGGGCAPTADFQRCSIAQVPAAAVVATDAFRRSPAGAAAIAALAEAGGDPAFVAAATRAGALSEGTEGLAPFSGSFIDYIGKSTLAAYVGVEEMERDADFYAASPPAAGAAAGAAPAAAGAGAAPAAGAGAALRAGAAFGVAVAAVAWL